MNKYSIRFNKTRGQPGRGTVEHVWRVFENGKEYLFKNLDITVPIKSEKDGNGVDYNICCLGYMEIDRVTSTAHITSVLPDDDLFYVSNKKHSNCVYSKEGVQDGN